MVRTRETASVKVVGAKAPRKASFTPAATSSDDSSGKNKYSGGNSYCPRETPAWQKNITSFFNATPSSSNDDAQGDSSTKSATDDSSPKDVTETAPSSESNSIGNSASSNNKDSSNKENEGASSS